MAMAYSKVLQALGEDFRVIGRSPDRAQLFRETTGVDMRPGGLKDALENCGPPATAIVAVNVRHLADCTRALLEAGVKRILLEKPGFSAPAELAPLNALAQEQGADVWLGYNRRFYASVQAAQHLIQAEGGPSSFFFDFTEWAHQIRADDYAESELANWVIANSSHIIDLAFYLGGAPSEIHCLTSGDLAWHPAAGKFSGCGRTSRGALFSYSADWTAPGRWGVEVMTPVSRYIFRPLEKLSIMRKGSVAIEPVVIDDEVDQSFKPGVLRQTQAFLVGQPEHFVTLSEQLERLTIFCDIAGYPKPH